MSKDMNTTSQKTFENKEVTNDFSFQKDIFNPWLAYEAISEIFSRKEYVTSFIDNKVFDFSTSSNESKIFVDYKKNINNIQNIINKKVRENLEDTLVKELVDELEKFSDEYEEYPFCENKIIEIANKYSFDILGNVIQSIYVKFFHKSNYLCGICKSLMRYDIEEVSPWGPAIIPGLLSHKEDIVIEYAVSLIESWNSVEMLPILKNINVSVGWLKSYINTVINRLEKQNVLHKKIN